MPRRQRVPLATKRRWFDRGAAALKATLPHLADVGYCCPLCLHASTSIDAFTVEDVPPRRVGGRPLVLTCKNCNDFGGHQFDWHWGNSTVLEGFALGELPEPQTVRLRYADGAATTAELTATGRQLQLAIVKKASSGAAIEQQEATLSGIQGTPAGAFTISFHKSRFSEARARLSVLRAAYLVGFALTGYRFLGVWTPIREQLNVPDERRTQRLVHYDRTHSTGRRELAIIEEPRDCVSYLVGFDRWTAYLPLSRESRLWRPITTKESIQFKGSRLEPWPTDPTFGRANDTNETRA